MDKCIQSIACAQTYKCMACSGLVISFDFIKVCVTISSRMAILCRIRFAITTFRKLATIQFDQQMSVEDV